ncbi:hypothetical protein BN970_02432 [Mycolicibacterium conceptionense]|uniref:Uncharacterized protein n=1 Tax=Mycolicibacterium conceptionense TaxID=451644 RepID=A0A0U1DBD4_9MYCO|nr:hypothetical protein BN970_02432 [Mycolicibacterium conceptionense]
MDAYRTFADLDHVDQQARADARGQAGGDFLAVRGGGQDDPGRGGRLGQRGQHVDDGGEQVVLRVVGLGDVDLGRTGGLEAVDQTGGGARLAHHNCGGLTQGTGGGDQLGADLLQCAFGVLNEHKYFSHEFSLRLSEVGG